MNRKTALLATLALAALPLWGPPDGLPPTAASMALGEHALTPHESLLYWAVLDADQESAKPNSGAGGWALVTVSGDGALEYSISTWGVEGTAAHIHSGVFGEDGPVAFALAGGGSAWEGTTARLNSAESDRLAAGGLYINVHSGAHPDGEIRGQLLPMPSLFGTPPDGLPPTHSTDNALFWLEPDGSLSYRVETQWDNSTVTLASNSATLANLGTGQNLGGRTDPLSEGDLRALLTCGLKVDISTSQSEKSLLLRALPNLFTAALSGDQASPQVETEASGDAYFLLQPNGKLAYRLSLSGLSASAAHLHAGEAGRTGPPVFHLMRSPAGYAGTGDLDRGTVNALMHGGVYINVHSQEHPGGEIRGQLAPMITPFMNGCASAAAF